MVRFSNEEFVKVKELLVTYGWAYEILRTKLKIVHEDFKNFSEDNPIDHIRGRMKSPESIAAKLSRLGHDITVENAKQYIHDIAGVRIICPFARDIKQVISVIRDIPGLKIVTEKDYISKPKKSGYRSYHLIIEVPVFYSGVSSGVPVEVQIRTEAMNFWASLEHEARYKFQTDIPQHLAEELEACARQIAALDHRMFLIHENVLGRSTSLAKEEDKN